MSKSAQQSTHASITGLASIIMGPTLVNVLRDGRGKTVRKVGDFKSIILNYSTDVIFCELTLKKCLF